jgi:ribonucleoside-diphosphate reductase alpha chain
MEMTIITKDRGSRNLPFDRLRLERFIDRLFYDMQLDSSVFKEKIICTIEKRKEYKATAISKQMILNALDEMSLEEPSWDKIAVRIKLKEMYKEASRNRSYDADKKYGSLFGLLKKLGSLGIYDSNLLKKYTVEEINELETMIDPTRDELFTYAGLQSLVDRYLTKDYDGNLYELPQERWMIIAMTLLQDEDPVRRLTLIHEAYWALSNLYMTVATPTLANAGKSFGQFSSCFIDTVEDSLEGIYNSNTDVARLSKNGGGIGVYIGKVRSLGSDIKGFKGASSGVIPWIKQLNNTAVSVDQLGTRKGAIAVYLDVWHKDIFSFLELKLNNGDERKRAHDIFTGVCIPDIFMEQLQVTDENGKSVGEWYLFDPHEVRKVMGFCLEDFYDEKRGDGSFRSLYFACVNNPNLTKKRVLAMDIMKAIMKSQLETGTPYMFYRDTVNRDNANKHKGMIYSSNLCTEIVQNMSPTTVEQEFIEDRDGERKLVIVKKMGDFVVCNLSSINLGRAVPDNVLERLIPIQVRMLDNVIDLNKGRLEVLQAEETNIRYRAIGLGTFGLHHLLALKNIHWESEEALVYNDKLYEEITYLTLKASHELAQEKGTYPYFQGSDFHTGDFFVRRGYTSKRWIELKEAIQQNGIRNGYLQAVAPNGSTSIIAGSTASIDPIFKKIYTEEKKGMKIPVVVPDLDPSTTWFYKSAYLLDQHWSIEQNARRQKHIDQSLSFNFYVKNTIKAKELLHMHIHAWKAQLKTTYYVRSTSQKEIDECESCQ